MPLPLQLLMCEQVSPAAAPESAAPEWPRAGCALSKDEKPYRGPFADFYDVFYGHKPYEAEAAFLNTCWRRHAAGSIDRVLELACGTGEHAFALEALGHRLVAVDASPDMLQRAQAKAAARGSAIDFQLQDMRRLDMPLRQFDVACCLFDSLGYVVSNAALGETLCRIHAHLRSGGLLAFDFWHAAAMLRHYDPVRVRRWFVAGGEVLRISETALDVGRQVCQVAFSIIQRLPDGRGVWHQETHLNRFFSVPEMEAWLNATGFEPIAWHAGYSDETRITDQTWHVLAVARKRATLES